MITQEELKRLLRYDAETGEFYWLVSPCNRIKVGDMAGSMRSDGYKQIMVNKKMYLAHRLVFLYIDGEFPTFADHINRVRHDNRRVNLRSVTRAENQQNIKIRSDNRSGILGVAWCRISERWTARIKVNSKTSNLGHFVKFEDAVMARYKAERELNWLDKHSSSYQFLKERNLIGE